MKQYLNSLIRKHRKLDKQIAQGGSQKFGASQLRDLKKLRLMLKDQITRLQRGPQNRSNVDKARCASLRI